MNQVEGFLEVRGWKVKGQNSKGGVVASCDLGGYYGPVQVSVSPEGFSVLRDDRGFDVRLTYIPYPEEASQVLDDAEVIPARYKRLRLFDVRREVTSADPGELIGAVVVALDPIDASFIHPNSALVDVRFDDEEGEWTVDGKPSPSVDYWPAPCDVVVTYLGEAAPGSKRGVVRATTVSVV